MTKRKKFDVSEIIGKITPDEQPVEPNQQVGRQKVKYLRHKVSGKLWAYEPNLENKPHFEVVELYPDEVNE